MCCLGALAPVSLPFWCQMSKGEKISRIYIHGSCMGGVHSICIYHSFGCVSPTCYLLVGSVELFASWVC